MTEKVFSLRLPADKYEQTASLAKDKKVSINNLIKSWVEQGLLSVTMRFVVEKPDLKRRIRSRSIAASIEPKDVIESLLLKAFNDKPAYELLADDIEKLESSTEGKLCRLESGSTGADAKRIKDLIDSIGQDIIRVIFYANKNENNKGVLITVIEAPRVKFLLDTSLINIARMPRLFEVQSITKAIYEQDLQNITYYCPRQIDYKYRESIQDSLLSLEDHEIKALGLSNETIVEFLSALYPPFSKEQFLKDKTEWSVDKFFPRQEELYI